MTIINNDLIMLTKVTDEDLENLSNLFPILLSGIHTYIPLEIWNSEFDDDDLKELLLASYT